MIVVDADFLGRGRTGDETYVENLLRALAPIADVPIAAIVRDVALVPDGIVALELATGSQEVRMAWSVPRLLARVRPRLAHFVHSLPLRVPCPAVVTVQDLSFERDPSLMSAKDRFVFRRVVPRAVRRAAKVIAISERTKRDVVELYGVPDEKVVVTPLGVDPAFRPNGAADGRYALFVGAVQDRKDPIAALDAARAAGLPLVVAGPEKDEALAAELRRRGADVRGYVAKEELARLYREAAVLVLPSRYEGFGLPVVEAMASGTPVVAAPDDALREVAGDAALFASRDELGGAVQRALVDRERLVAAGLERARAFTWEETARRTLEVYREVIG
ncbi:MAG TPA: glycosyltransferase family 1 protein [Gaiellaceae bacterium]|nr:glycosyltransferase family 1 protein [Gaiellaceae bacterium]